MSLSRIALLAAFLTGSLYGGLGCAQGPETARIPASDSRAIASPEDAPSSPLARAGSLRVRRPHSLDTLDLRSLSSGRAAAHRAAWVDPGILWYEEPASGTNMPILTPRADVDPEMIRPGTLQQGQPLKWRREKDDAAEDDSMGRGRR